jgi:type IV pilus assembly protein PilM
MPGARSILGIDLRIASVKVVEIEKKQNKTVLKNWGLTEIPYNLVDKHPEKEDAQAEALRKLIQTRKMRSREAVAVVGGSDTFVKLYTLSEIGRAEAAEALRWKFAEEIPFPIEEAIVDFYPLPKKESSQNVDYVAACIHVNLYREIEYIIRKAGLKLAAVTVMPDALQQVFEGDILEDKEKIVSLIYMGKRTTNISILKDGNLEFNRELNIGGENITLAMSGVLVAAEGRVEINPDEAEKIKIDYGVPIDIEKYPKLAEIPINQLQAMVRPALERVKDEIMRTFEYYKGQTGEAVISKIILTGGSSLTINLVDFLSESLGIPVETPNAMEGRDYDAGIPDRPFLDKVLSRLSAAIGAALVGDEKINLVPPEIKHRYRLLLQKVAKPQYLLPAFVAFLLLAYLGFWFYAYNLKSELDSVQKKLKEYAPRLEALNILEKTAREEERKRTTFSVYREKGTKIPKVFEEISRLIPPGIVIRTLNMTTADLHMWGTAFEERSAAETIMSRFVLALSASEYFGEVKLVQAAKNYDYLQDAFNFEIVAKLKL